MADENGMLRGAPRYLTGPAAGAAGLLTVIPEARLSADGRQLQPAGVVVLHPDGVRRYPIPGRRVGGRRAPSGDIDPVPDPTRPKAPDGLAESLVVPGADSPDEDPRLAAAFGPTQATAHGVRIPLWRVDGASGVLAGRRAPLGMLEVVNGAVEVELAPSRGLRNRRRALLVVICFAIAWWVRRAR